MSEVPLHRLDFSMVGGKRSSDGAERADIKLMVFGGN